MKRLFYLLLIIMFVLSIDNSEAQLLKRLKKRAVETVERKLENKTERETGEAMDEILDGEGSKKDAGNAKGGDGIDAGNAADMDAASTSGSTPNSIAKSSAKDKISFYTKSDFVPGDKTLFYDDFSQDAVGDFPVNWDTDFSGDIVKLEDGSQEKYLRMVSGAKYRPISDFVFPENYTIEFDVVPIGLKGNTSSSCKLEIFINDGTKFNFGNTFSFIAIPFVAYVTGSFEMKSYEDGNQMFSNVVSKDISKIHREKMRVSILVNNKRYRLFLNGEKTIDLPRFSPDNSKLNSVQFHAQGLESESEFFLISDFRVAATTPDLRSSIFADNGKFSTDAILFDVNSANIRPESYGILKEIAAAVNEQKGKKINIIGHTDSDGADDANLKLSKSRADAVKTALVENFNVDSSQISTEGKGESEPLVNNDNSANKAKNRRVEFVILN